MAETNFQASQGISLLFGSGSKALGTAHVEGDQFDALPVISFTVPHDSAALEVASPRSGTLAQLEGQAKHRRDANIWTFDVSFKGTPTAVTYACLWAFGDGSSECLLAATSGIGNGTNNSASMTHNTAYTNAATVVFSNAGSDATANDVVARGCIAQSMTLKEDVGSESGQLVCDVTFWTAYPPVEEANTVSADATDTAAPKSIFSLSASTLNAEPLLLNSWELTMSRSLERVGSQDYSSYLPFGYVQTGPWEVNGSLNAKRDDSILDLIAQLQGDSTGINLSIDESSGFNIDLPDTMIEGPSTSDNGGAFQMQTIPFRAFAASTTATIVGVTIA